MVGQGLHRVDQRLARRVPQFVGHDQPRLPGELGFYDLRVPEVQRAPGGAGPRGTASTASATTTTGSAASGCSSGRWTQSCASPAIDFPFCLCWANENWTRRWDGHEDEMLMAQDHGPDSDAAFIATSSPSCVTELHPRSRPAGGAGVPPGCCAIRRPPLPVARAVPRGRGCPTYISSPPRRSTRSTPRHRLRRGGGVPAQHRGARAAGRDHRPRARGADVGRQGLPVCRHAARAAGAPDATSRFRAVCTGFDNEPGVLATARLCELAPAYGRWLGAACRAALAAPSPTSGWSS